MNEVLETQHATPGFSLAYLLAWVGGCAVLFALDSPELGSSIPAWVMPFFITTQAMTYAAGFVGLGLCGWWWRQGRRIAWQPGHWLLCVVGVLGIVYVATRLLGLEGLQADFSIGTDAVRNFVSTFSTTARLTALIAAMVCVPLAWPWRVVPLLRLVHIIAIDASGYAMTFFGVGVWDPWLKWVYSAAWCGALMALVVLAVRDAVKRTPRDWMHWAGVAAWMLLYVPEMVAGWVLWVMS